jgi:4a-hydroxytetrahydrobiopterin dehydratase
MTWYVADEPIWKDVPMSTAPLSDDRITAALAALPGWARIGEALEKTYRFATFREAIGFMQSAADDIDRLDHHPEWTNVYNRLTVRLTTHDAGNRITAKDVEVAKHLEWLIST